MAYFVGFTSRAEKQLHDLPREVQEAVADLRRELAVEPRGPGTKKLKGARAHTRYSRRIGRAYRVVFTIDDESDMVLIVLIGPRGDVYRGLGR